MLALVVVAGLAVVIIVPGFVTSLVAFGLAGIANSLFFAATLAARSEYAPAEARGQVLIWVGALKIAAGSAGTAVAGALIGVTWLPVVVVAGLTAVSAAVCAVERRHQSQR